MLPLFTPAWLIGAGATALATGCTRRPDVTLRPLGAALIGIGLALAATPASADQYKQAADSASIACTLSRHELTRIALVGDQFASVSKISSGTPFNDFAVTHEPVRGDIYLSVPESYLPRVTLLHTSAESRGQVYAPMVNILLLIAVIALVLLFRSSGALAAAFGLAVTATMVLTTLMIGFVVFRIWRWNPIWAVPLYGVLLLLDLGLLTASSTKFLDGGWLPVSIAVSLVIVFATWRRGRILLRNRLAADAMPTDTFIASTANVTRVPATAIYLTAASEGMPPALLHNLKNNLVIHRDVVLLTVETALTPIVPADRRATVSTLGRGFHRIIVRYGFAESPDVPAALAAIEGLPFDASAAAYFLSRQTVIPSRRPGMPLWQDRLFSAMVRNSETPMSFFKLPTNRVVELGSQIEI